MSSPSSHMYDSNHSQKRDRPQTKTRQKRARDGQVTEAHYSWCQAKRNEKSVTGSHSHRRDDGRLKTASTWKTTFGSELPLVTGPQKMFEHPRCWHRWLSKKSRCIYLLLKNLRS